LTICCAVSFQVGSWFLGLRWLDTALDFPIGGRSIPIQSSVKPEHSKTPSWPQNVLGNCGTLSPTLRVRLLPLLLPFLRAFASSREIPDPGFLDCGGLTPLWIFPSAGALPIPSSVQPEHSKTPSWQQSVIGNCGTLSQPFAPSRLRVRLFSPPVKTLELWD
jgi:hypothetical protein